MSGHVDGPPDWQPDQLGDGEPSGAGSRYPPAVYFGAGLIGVMLVAILVLVVLGGGGGGDGGEGDDGADGETASEGGPEDSTGPDPTDAPANGGTDPGTVPEPAESGVSGGETNEEEWPDHGYPPPDVVVEASPPTTQPGTEPRDYAGLALTGQLPVTVEAGTFADTPTQLPGGDLASMAVAFTGPEGMRAALELYAPDGERIGYSEVNAGVVAIAEYDLELSGTYIFRVVHLRGDAQPFALTIYT